MIDDNTWATALYHRSLDQGVDISMQAATKYVGGHSDIMFGTISANARAWPMIAEAIRLLGVCAGSRRRVSGAARFAHARSPAGAASSIRRSRSRAGSRPGPRLSGCCTRPRKRSGPCDLETGFYRRVRPVQHRPEARAATGRRCACSTPSTLFGMGYSWGGFESLIIPFDCAPYRTATKWAPGGPALRLHIGLENVDDLKCDLERGFAAFNAA